MQLSITKTLLFLLPLAAAPLAQAQDLGDVINDVTDTVSSAADSVSEFFGPDGPGGRIGAFPDCAHECLRRVAGDLNCGPSDISCLCGSDQGVNWNNRVAQCNSNNTQGACDENAMNQVDLDGICRAIDGVDAAIDETGDAFGRLLGLDDENAAGHAKAAGTVTIGVLAAVAGYAAMML
ncbi:CFEM domain-containing protein [Madurella fahalii]|uniref:CFEM domain-containing protein n=1 Tax=Madurella fahalii TaxID=1157608 RepID=A0ABQ0GJY7_9PEZI